MAFHEDGRGTKNKRGKTHVDRKAENKRGGIPWIPIFIIEKLAPHKRVITKAATICLNFISLRLYEHCTKYFCSFQEAKLENLKRIVIGVDPAVSAQLHSAETGIIVAGIDEHNIGYVLEDLSGKFGPTEWAKRVIEAYWRYEADRVVAEINQGGDLVEHTLRHIDPNVSFKSVRAMRGKMIRAEPIVALYEQRRIFHMYPFKELEKQMCTFTAHGKGAADRMDALVWAITELMIHCTYHKTPSVWKV